MEISDDEARSSLEVPAASASASAMPTSGAGGSIRQAALGSLPGHYTIEVQCGVKRAASEVTLVLGIDSEIALTLE